MTKTILAVMCLTSIGCLRSIKPINYAGEDFKHTGSLCLDSLLVNLDHEGCNDIKIQDNSNSIIIKCGDSTESAWNNHIFLLAPGVAAMNYQSPPLCMDFNYMLFLYAKKEKNKEEK
ncbi:hypothetical protein OAA09_00080 [bacterium]|nr:hypothetical protein [bacterium]